MKGELVRHWTDDPFELRLYDLGTRDSMGKNEMGYEFFHDGERIFEGNDFSVSPMHAVDSDDAVFTLLSFLSLQSGDTDKEYFDHYTKSQIAWRDSHAEDLGVIVVGMEEGEYEWPDDPVYEPDEDESAEAESKD